MSKARPIEERFWEKVDKSGGPDACWPWMAYCNPTRGGYGSFMIGSRTDNSRTLIGAHVMAWELENGKKVPSHLQIMHSCNCKPCCNPAHLSPGTSQQDANYKVLCDRQSKGVETGQSKLTDDNVRELHKLRDQGWLQRELAEKYGVSQPTISKVCTRKKWTHVK